MQAKTYASFLAVVLVAPFLSAFAKDQPSGGFQQGTVLSVEPKEVRSPDTCCYSGTDNPLQSEYYAFEISVRVGCTTYEGRCETPFHYFPTAFSPGKSIQVRPTKHELYFEVPIWGDSKVPIMHRTTDRAAPCCTSTASQ
jgi:hypothetical protein